MAMIEQVDIENLLAGKLGKMNLFLVEVKVRRNNRILVHVDSMEGVRIDECALVSKFLEGKLDREKEDFDLEVSSPGIDAPFRVIEQYRKNKGKEVKVALQDGITVQGTLKEISEEGIVVEKKIGKKKSKEELPETHQLNFDRIESVRICINF